MFINICEQLFTGIRNLHELNIVHGNLYFGNIFFKQGKANELSRLYIGDLGKAVITKKLDQSIDAALLAEVISGYIALNWLGWSQHSLGIQDMGKISKALVMKGILHFVGFMKILKKMQKEKNDLSLEEWKKLESTWKSLR